MGDLILTASYILHFGLSAQPEQVIRSGGLGDTTKVNVRFGNLLFMASEHTTSDMQTHPMELYGPATFLSGGADMGLVVCPAQ